MLSRRLFLATAACAGVAPAKPYVGPEKGSLVIVGGGRLPDSIINAFVDLGGGKSGAFVIIPTAGEDIIKYDQAWADKQFLTKAGVSRVSVLHTRDRKEADTSKFVEPLKTAGGVWFPGGRQWRLVDSYLNTRTHRELWKLLKRGGVIGGSSAGATIQGSYLVRGAREGNSVMMAPGYEVGMGFLRNVAVDQHLLRRNRQDDLISVVERHRHLLGIGIDESTAIIVRQNDAQVIGESKVAIYDPQRGPGPDGKRYYFLNPGERFDLAGRRRL
jgi:cyanophycinase